MEEIAMLRSPPMACRRVTTTICAVLLTTGLILHSNVGTTAESPEPINIVVTIPVLKDLAEQVGGPYVRVTSLLKGYENEHTYSPKPSDLVAVRNAQVLFEVGLGLEVWVANLVKSAGRPSLIVVTTSKGIALISDDHDSDSIHQDTDHHTRGNPHVWMDPENAITMMRHITETLV